MYLNETGLLCKENANISGPLQESGRPFMSNEQDLMLEDNYQQVKKQNFVEWSLTSKDNQ